MLLIRIMPVVRIIMAVNIVIWKAAKSAKIKHSFTCLMNLNTDPKQTRIGRILLRLFKKSQRPGDPLCRE